MGPSVENEMIQFQGVTQENGFSVVSFSVPTSLYPHFIRFISSVYDMFHYSLIKSKQNHLSSRTHQEAFQQARHKEYQALEDSILHVYDAAVSSAKSSREAINIVKSDFLKRDIYLTCYSIELTCRSHGRFKKGNLKNV